MPDKSHDAAQQQDWVIELLIGPCTEDEASAMFDTVTEFVGERKLDATCVMRLDEATA